MPNAHTDGDSIVFGSRMHRYRGSVHHRYVSGDRIPLAGGWKYLRIVEAQDRIVDLIIPVYGQEGGTLVVPGHGRLCELGDVINYREMTIIIRDRIQDMVKKGNDARTGEGREPTFDYDPLYGTSTGFWTTTDMFVEAVYKSLSRSRTIYGHSHCYDTRCAGTGVARDALGRNRRLRLPVRRRHRKRGGLGSGTSLGTGSTVTEDWRCEDDPADEGRLS